jgi:hypothetical protein
VVYGDAADYRTSKGMVYQIWSLATTQLTPTSIGLLSDFSNNSKIFAVDKTGDAEAFGITLEPAGGSLNPTMELYTLGKFKSLLIIYHKLNYIKNRLSIESLFFYALSILILKKKQQFKSLSNINSQRNNNIKYIIFAFLYIR